MKFKVGDRVRVLALPGRRWSWHKPGDVGIVMSVYPHIGEILGQAYMLDITPATHWICEGALELVPPAREQTIPWSQCEWQPRDLNVTV